MQKFNVNVDERCTIYRRYELEIEAKTLKEAEEIALKQIKEDYANAISATEYLYDTATPMTRKEFAATAVVDFLMPDDEWEILYGFNDKDIEIVEIVK